MEIWILNHYATMMGKDGIGRHHSFAKYLTLQGHSVKLFCANTVHNSRKQINLGNKLYKKIKEKDDIPYYFVKSHKYNGNGFHRVMNMISYSVNVKKVMKRLVENGTKPDVIIASSVHPFTLLSGIQFGKKYKIPCICEVRDLWPESIVCLTRLTKRNLLIKILYQVEKRIYMKADQLIFTMEGGKQYIIDKKWQKKIDLNKVFHINNGVDLEIFNQNKEKYQIDDEDLKSNEGLNIVYAGSIRKANNVEFLVELAKELKMNNVEGIRVLIYGDGPDLNELKNKVREFKLDNIILKGAVNRNNIPYVLSTGKSVNFLHYIKLDVLKYGSSANKLFEYFASGKPILSTVRMGYDLLERYDAGITIEDADKTKLLELLIQYRDMSPDEYGQICKNVHNAAQDYDFKKLTKKLLIVIDKAIKEYRVEKND